MRKTLVPTSSNYEQVSCVLAADIFFSDMTTYTGTASCQVWRKESEKSQRQPSSVVRVSSNKAILRSLSETICHKAEPLLF